MTTDLLSDWTDYAIERLREFVEKRRTGQITLNVKDGKVRSVDFRECVPLDSR